MRVMFVSHVANKYGAGRSLLSFIDGLLQKGVQCHVILPKEGPMAEDLRELGVEYSIIPLKNWTSGPINLWKRVLRNGFNLFVIMAIVAKARTWRADMLYTNSSVTPVGAFAAFLLRKPHIWHIREFGQEDYGLSFDLGEWLSMKLIGALACRVIVISEALRQKYIRYISSGKIRKIYNPVELSSLATDDSHTEYGTNNKLSTHPSLAIIGLLHPGKGQLDAVLAAAELIRQGIQVRLTIVGDGDREYLKQIKGVIVQNRIEEYVEFTGYVNDPVPVMNSADVVLVCSRSEAFGRVTIEAMLAGKPVIGARSGATPELIRDGFNGLLYEPRRPKDLAEKIKYLIDHPKEAKQLGVNGSEWASKEFTVEKCSAQVYAVLKEAM